jgi:hypothetical protein
MTEVLWARALYTSALPSPRGDHTAALCYDTKTSLWHGRTGSLLVVFVTSIALPLQGVLFGFSMSVSPRETLHCGMSLTRFSREMLLNPIEHFSNYIVAYLLKARTVEPEKQPLLGNDCNTQQ